LREIGEGQFGKVLLMKAKNIAGYKGKIPVAVKTLSSIDEEDVKKFLEEIELMKKFASPRIVSLLGNVTTVALH
jgi:serine/threonine protein kinase